MFGQFNPFPGEKNFAKFFSLGKKTLWRIFWTCRILDSAVAFLGEIIFFLLMFLDFVLCFSDIALFYVCCFSDFVLCFLDIAFFYVCCFSDFVLCVFGHCNLCVCCFLISFFVFLCFLISLFVFFWKLRWRFLLCFWISLFVLFVLCTFWIVFFFLCLVQFGFRLLVVVFVGCFDCCVFCFPTGINFRNKLLINLN